MKVSFDGAGKLFILFFFLSGVFTSFFCSAQFQSFSNQLYFKQFNTDDGLSQASVNCILKDSRGFMWFGTEDGLNRFDGSRFKIFRNQADDSTSLRGNTILSIVEDKQGNIWVGTSEGLNRFDRHSEQFRYFPLRGAEYYSCFDLELDEKDQTLWIAAGPAGVCYLNMPTGDIHRLEHQQPDGMHALRIAMAPHRLYVGTMENGLLAFDLARLNTGNYKALIVNLNLDPITFALRSLLADGDILWAGLERGGLLKINTRSGKTKVFSSKKHALADDKVWSLALDKKNHLWIGTDGGGLAVLDPVTETFNIYQHSDYNHRTISGNTIRSILIDGDDAWFGTFNGGISYHPGFAINFLSFKKDPERLHSLQHNAVLSFCEMNDGSIWIGTDGGGLNFLKDGAFSRYKFPAEVEDPKVILSLHRSARTGDTWVGSYQNGLFLIKADKKVIQFKYHPEDAGSIPSDIIWDIAEDEDGNIWLATETGIARFKLENGEFTSYRNLSPVDNPVIFTDQFIQTLLIDSNQNLWGGFYGYLLSYDIKSGTTREFREVPNKPILSLHQDRTDSNIIWFAAHGGALVRFDTKTSIAKSITEKEGLPNNLIFAVESDHSGRLWLTTNKGLVRFDQTQNNFYVFNENFGVDTGPFKDNSSYMTSDGHLLFGGTNGFTSFVPAEINFLKNQLNVTYTNFQLSNREVPIDNKILRRSIMETSHIELPYNEARFVTFEFSALQFLAPDLIQYQYKLEGFADSWNQVDASRKVTFTNLQPGDYKLRIRAGYASQFWGEESLLEIKVVPAWWMTTYAYSAAFLLIAGLAFGYYRYRVFSFKRHKLELEKIVAEQYSEITHKNEELALQNIELSNHNEALLSHRQTISLQNLRLNEAQMQLRAINHSLENSVQQRTEKLHETIAQLNKTIKELDAFLYSASHDLTAPLKSILGLVTLAKREVEDNSTLNVYYHHIETSVYKLEGVIYTFMQQSFNSKAEVQPENVDLKLLVRDCVDELQFMHELQNIDFQLELDNAVVLADKQRMKIVLSNLISNAVKYHDPRKPAKLITINFKKDLASWFVRVRDNGIGIHDARLSRVFDMFYRATESAKGSGLGLYIVKEAVERMNGKIEVSSTYGLWTEFTVTFPIDVTMPDSFEQRLAM